MKRLVLSVCKSKEIFILYTKPTIIVEMQLFYSQRPSYQKLHIWTLQSWKIYWPLIHLALTVFCRYIKVPKGNFGVYDPTEIHRMGQLKNHMRDAVIGLAYYLIFFFIYLYWYVVKISYPLTLSFSIRESGPDW